MTTPVPRATTLPVGPLDDSAGAPREPRVIPVGALTRAIAERLAGIGRVAVEGEVMEIAHSGRNLELEVKVQGGPLPELAILRRPRKLPEI